MTCQHDKPKRWRPRFSVRTLAIVVTLVCCYAACWGPTKTRGVAALAHDYELSDDDDIFFCSEGPLGMFDTSAAAPLLIRQDELSFAARSTRRHYYFWFFGYVAKLPYERNIYPLWQEVLEIHSHQTTKERLGLR